MVKYDLDGKLRSDKQRRKKLLMQIEKESLVKEFLDSGLTAIAFEKTKGMKPSTFYGILKEYAPDRIPRQKKLRISLVKEFLNSDKTTKAFVESKGISRSRFYQLLKKYDPDGSLRDERVNNPDMFSKKKRDIIELINKFIDSGLTQKSFAELDGIKPKIFYKYLEIYDPDKKLRNQI